MQIHLGAYYPRGQYVRTRNLNQLQKWFEQELKSYHTDYADIGKIDIFMLSLNAAYDFEPSGEKLTLSDTRMKLYQECSKSGVGITVMKPYGGGKLLNERTSPLGRKMSRY